MTALWNARLNCAIAPMRGTSYSRSHEKILVRSSGPRWCGAYRCYLYPAGRYSHAGLHACGHGCHGQGDDARKRRRNRCGHPAGQYLSSDAAPHCRTDRPFGRAAQVHELGQADPHRFRRVSGDEPVRAAQADGKGRDLQKPCGRVETRTDPRTVDGDSKAARLRYRHVL